MKLILGKSPNLLSTSDRWGRTPLHMAALRVSLSRVHVYALTTVVIPALSDSLSVLRGMLICSLS